MCMALASTAFAHGTDMQESYPPDCSRSWPPSKRKAYAFLRGRLPFATFCYVGSAAMCFERAALAIYNCGWAPCGANGAREGRKRAGPLWKRAVVVAGAYNLCVTLVARNVWTWCVCMCAEILGVGLRLKFCNGKASDDSDLDDRLCVRQRPRWDSAGPDSKCESPRRLYMYISL